MQGVVAQRGTSREDGDCRRSPQHDIVSHDHTIAACGEADGVVAEAAGLDRRRTGQHLDPRCGVPIYIAPIRPHARACYTQANRVVEHFARADHVALIGRAVARLEGDAHVAARNPVVVEPQPGRALIDADADANLRGALAVTQVNHVASDEAAGAARSIHHYPRAAFADIEDAAMLDLYIRGALREDDAVAVAANVYAAQLDPRASNGDRAAQFNAVLHGGEEPQARAAQINVFLIDARPEEHLPPVAAMFVDGLLDGPVGALASPVRVGWASRTHKESDFFAGSRAHGNAAHERK